MTSPTPSDVYRAQITARLGTAEMLVHSLHFASTAGIQGDVTAQALADQVKTAFTAAVLTGASTGDRLGQVLSSGVVYQKVDTYRLDSAGRAIEQGTSAFQATPAVTGASASRLPDEVAMCVTLVSGLPGRSRRGRCYLGGLAAGTIAQDGTFAGTQAQMAATHFGGFLANVDTAGWQPVIYSRVLGISTPIINVSVGTVPDVQRRRRNKLQELRYTRATPF